MKLSSISTGFVMNNKMEQSSEIRNYGPIKFRVRGSHDEEIISEVAIRGTYERPNLGVGVARGDVWLDCGANIAAFGVWAEKMRGAVVRGYEACEENAILARENLRLNDCASTVTTAFVSANSSGYTEVGFNERTPARSGSAQAKNRRAVQNVSLVEEIERHRPQGVKIDIEGAEMELLEARFPLAGIRVVILEYHFRLDNSCANARERVRWLCSHFKHHRIPSQVMKSETWRGWQDAVMLFWD